MSGVLPGDPRHGTVSFYTYYGCRCYACYKAASDSYYERVREGLPPDDPRHGTENAYVNYGCRCDPCRDGARAARRARARRQAEGADL